jgi:hypothetical protein
MISNASRLWHQTQLNYFFVSILVSFLLSLNLPTTFFRSVPPAHIRPSAVSWQFKDISLCQTVAMQDHDAVEKEAPGIAEYVQNYSKLWPHFLFLLYPSRYRILLLILTCIVRQV